MGRAPCCDKIGLKKGPWSAQEDQILISYIHQHGHPNWRALPKQAGLLRCGKSCRLRWVNYLSPSIKRGNFSSEEEEAIIKLHQIMGNRWSAIAAKLPGRTDNEIKNIWHTHLKKRLNKSDDKIQNLNIDDYPPQSNTNGGCSDGNNFYPQTVQSPQDSVNTTTSTLTTTSNTTATGTTHQQEVSVSTSLGEEVSEMSQSISSGIPEIDDESFWWQNLMAEHPHSFNSSCIPSPVHPDPLHQFGFGFGFDDQQHHTSYTNTSFTGDHHTNDDFWYGVFIGAGGADGGGSLPDILPDF